MNDIIRCYSVIGSIKRKKIETNTIVNYAAFSMHQLIKALYRCFHVIGYYNYVPVQHNLLGAGG